MTQVITVTAPGTTGFDTASILDSSQIATMWDNSPYLIALADVVSGTTSEIQNYVQQQLSQGFYVGLYRGYYSGMFDSDPSSVGAAHAQQCIDVANGFSGAAGMTLWCDLEGATANTTIQDIIDYANSFNSTCQAAGYEGGVYVGDDEPYAQMDGSQLYYDLTTSHYWRCCSSSIWPTVDNGQVRGWQILQTSCEYDYDGIVVDNDSIQTDQLGGNAVFIKLS
ncbi:glycoside hydrolase domain-containing protein [Alicyclobacillus tolerans]|uniref:glycoside hydrolase domain-containing protein n=1 Tax=Alicyclobacillus tolerans TaxID=90970 RepID=UPI003B81EF00